MHSEFQNEYKFPRGYSRSIFEGKERSAVIDDERLGRCEFMQCGKTFFATVAALAGTSEWKLDSSSRSVAVHENLTGAELLAHAHLAAAITRPDGCNQPVLGAVR